MRQEISALCPGGRCRCRPDGSGRRRRCGCAVAGAGTLGAACLAAEDFVAASVGDVAEFLDVDVHQLAGAVAFVAAYDPTGGPVTVIQAADAGSGAVHHGGHQVQQARDTCGAPAAQDADLDDAPLGARRGPARAAVGAAGAISHGGLAASTRR